MTLVSGSSSVASRIRLSIAPRRGFLSVVELIVLAGCVIAAVTARNRYAVDIMIRTYLWAGLALAWNLAGGYAGLISFGHAAFFGIGAYASTILLLNYGVSPWIGMSAGALLAAFAGALLTGQRKQLPTIYLTTGEVTKKAKELPELAGVIIKEIKP